MSESKCKGWLNTVQYSVTDQSIGVDSTVKNQILSKLANVIYHVTVYINNHVDYKTNAVLLLCIAFNHRFQRMPLNCKTGLCRQHPGFGSSLFPSLPYNRHSIFRDRATHLLPLLLSLSLPVHLLFVLLAVFTSIIKLLRNVMHHSWGHPFYFPT